MPLFVSIVNKCFDEGSFPVSEKRAAVVPIIKNNKLDKENLKNYRPVSNISLFSKVIEGSILHQLRRFFEENDHIPSVQSAYQKFCSTETALCKIHNDLVSNVCEGHSSMLILLDLSAAFDTIDQTMLLDDLWSCGIQGSAHKLLKNYLEDRTQNIFIGDHVSSPVELLYGVPQGSVLGPTLFIFHMAGLAKLLEAHGVSFHIYADDTQIYLPIYNIDESKNKATAVLGDVQKFMIQRKLKLNDDKTEIIIIKGNLRENLVHHFQSFNFGELEIEPALSVRDIGVLLDQSLNFESHINNVVSKSYFQLRNLYGIKRYLNRKCLETLVHSLIMANIDYCNVLYNGLPKKYLKKLQSVLNRSARLIMGLPPRYPTTRALISLHWLPIKARIEYKTCLITYKALTTNKPKYINDLLQIQEQMTTMTLRRDLIPFQLKEPRAAGGRTFASRSFSYNAPRLFNKLPTFIKTSSTVDKFKAGLKTYLFEKAYDIQRGCINESYQVQ